MRDDDVVDLILGEDGVRRKDVSRQWGKRVKSMRQEGERKRVPSIWMLPSPISFALATFIIPTKVSNIVKMR